MFTAVEVHRRERAAFWDGVLAGATVVTVVFLFAVLILGGVT